MTQQLPSNTVHLWTAQFDRLACKHAEFESLLADNERKRAERFISEAVSDKFIMARGWLRTVLAQYLDQSPESIAFVYGKRGKPSIQASEVHFNLTHSGNLLVLGVIRDREIGVDVEQIHPQPNMALVAHDNFSAKEFTALYELPEAERLQAFYNCWTRKEAYIKAVGDGFALPLQDFDVTLKSDEIPRFLRIKDDDPAKWSLLHIDTLDNAIGAVCVKGAMPQIKLMGTPIA